MPCQASTVALFAAETETLSAAGHLEFLDDPGGNLKFIDLIDAGPQADFEPLKGFLNRGFTESTSWLRFQVTRTEDAPGSLFLWLQPPRLDWVDVYVQNPCQRNDAAGYTRYRLGDNALQSEAALRHPKMVIPISLTDTTPCQIIIRVQTKGAHQLRAHLLSLDEHNVQTQWVSLLQGSYLAVAFALALVNALLALRLRDRVYGWYTLYLGTLFFSYLAIDGLLTLILPAWSHLLSDALAGAGTGLAYTFFSLFVMGLFQTRTSTPRVHRLLQIIMILGVITAAVSTHSYYNNVVRILTSMGLFLVLLCPVLAWLRLRSGKRDGPLFLLAFGANAIGALATFLHLLGLLPSNQFTLYALQYGSIAYMILMTQALSERTLSAEAHARTAAAEAEGKALAMAQEITANLSQNQQKLKHTLERECRLRDEQTRFIETISHEYRTPLSIISTHLDILRAREDGSDNRRFVTMANATKRLQEVFSDTLRASEMGRAPSPRFKPLDMAALLSSTLAEFSQSAAGDIVRFNGPENGQWVQGDASLLKTVLLNALENAFKYRHPSNASIDVWAITTIESVEIRIGNSTTPEKDLDADALFDRFVRGKFTKMQPGLGLGLYLIRRILYDHKGSATINRPNLQRFEIIISLPLWVAEER